MSPSKTYLEKFCVYCPPLLLDEIYARVWCIASMILECRLTCFASWVISPDSRWEQHCRCFPLVYTCPLVVFFRFWASFSSAQKHTHTCSERGGTAVKWKCFNKIQFQLLQQRSLEHKAGHTGTNKCVKIKSPLFLAWATISSYSCLCFWASSSGFAGRFLHTDTQWLSTDVYITVCERKHSKTLHI